VSGCLARAQKLPALRNKPAIRSISSAVKVKYLGCSPRREGLDIGKMRVTNKTVRPQVLADYDTRDRRDGQAVKSKKS